MPSWPSRLLASTHLPSTFPPESEPSASSASSLTPVPRPPHARSQSHQISSPFHPSSSSPPAADVVRGGERRQVHGRRSEEDLLGAAGGEDDSRGAGRGYNDMSPGTSSGGGSAQFLTGHCMCCDSTVRWPANLSVFRCTICMTINDLKPAGPTPPSRIIPHISVDETKAIINNCINEFLEIRKWIKQMPKYAPPPPPITAAPGGGEVEGDTGSKPRVASDTDALPSNGRRVPPIPPPGHPEDIPSSPLPGNTIPGQRGSREKLCGKEGVEFLDSEVREDSAGRPGDPRNELARTMFKQLDDYLFTTFSNWECLNGSFVKERKTDASDSDLTQPDNRSARGGGESRRRDLVPVTEKIGEKEAMLLMGRGRPGRDKTHYMEDKRRDKSRGDGKLSVRSPGIDWDSVNEFYEVIMNAAADYPLEGRLQRTIRQESSGADDDSENLLSQGEDETVEILAEIYEARQNTIKVLLKAIESMLKRPRRPLKKPEEVRFLLIVLANPLLYPPSLRPARSNSGPSSPPNPNASRTVGDSLPVPGGVPKRQLSNSSSRSDGGGGPGHQSAIIKRVFGLLSNLPNECHHYLVSWFTRMPEVQFRRLVELVGSFITYRLTRQHGRKRSHGGSGLAGPRGKQLVYNDDWQIRAAARVMSLFFSANNSAGRRGLLSPSYGQPPTDNLSPGQIARRQAQMRGQIIPTSDFYNMLLDYHDLIADFDAWESRTSKFCFCQYPFLLSMGAKISILEHDAKRQMEVQARQAFFNSISTRRAINQYLVLKVRRECLVEDSLKGISEGVGGVDDIKKGLRIEFVGEDGVDAGGLKKEWFLLVVRDVFDPNYGMFVYDEDSRYCYFNPNSFESSEEFFLVGVLFGLAIYNSTILDVSLPPYVFKKLLHFSLPHSLATSSTRPPLHQTLEDLAVFRPSLANGLRQLLEFEGDVESTFCRDFVAETERFGQVVHVALCPNGENRPVTNANRKEFVDLYLKYLLDGSVAKQFEPFKRGFYTVCGGNALSLFRPEEIELLVCGSDEALDVSALKAVAIYDGWGSGAPADDDPVVKWFWRFFEKISPKEQRMLLSFITGSDRIPAMGATNLIIKVVCLGQDSNRFPVARTCFNQICLWRYRRKDKLEKLLWRAVTESEGFGLK